MIILGLDMSSTCIGYAALYGDTVRRVGHEDLTGDIAVRCALAAGTVARLLDRYTPALVMLESPVARFAKAVIPQARVSGAVLAVLSARAALWAECTPQQAKYALCGDNAATKKEMVDEAAQRLQYPRDDIRVWRGKAYAYAMNGTRALSEDEADALGVALAGRALRVEVVA